MRSGLRLPQLPFCAAAVVAVAAQFRQQHPQLPLLGLLISQLFQQGRGLLLLIQHQQQLQQAPLVGFAG
jgi:hypothetical protein